MLERIIRFLVTVDHFEIFTEHEAWVLFKWAAIGEAFGWVLLLYGIAAQHYHLWGQSWALPIGGSVHGTLFIAYLLIVVFGYGCLNWPRWKGILAVCLSVIPIGTLVFEMYESRRRL